MLTKTPPLLDEFNFFMVVWSDFNVEVVFIFDNSFSRAELFSLIYCSKDFEFKISDLTSNLNTFTVGLYAALNNPLKNLFYR
jgi:hypothetical protein